MNDPYEVCRRVKRYHEKNGYAPKRSELGCDDAYVDALVKNGVIELRDLYDGGPKICVVLTDKGMRMAERR